MLPSRSGILVEAVNILLTNNQSRKYNLVLSNLFENRCLQNIHGRHVDSRLSKLEFFNLAI